ncbi:hypothetical protein CIW51_08490 [Mycolicibacterium sp. P9-22]|nr:hypothetical protein CIW51_08490 [Mycolicibacterium sp. P9-22]
MRRLPKTATRIRIWQILGIGGRTSESCSDREGGNGGGRFHGEQGITAGDIDTEGETNGCADSAARSARCLL